VQLLLPFVAGQLMRPWIADWVVRHAVLTKVVDRGSILLVVFTAFSLSMTEHVWGSVSAWRLLAVVAVCAVLLAIISDTTRPAPKDWGGSAKKYVDAMPSTGAAASSSNQPKP